MSAVSALFLLDSDSDLEFVEFREWSVQTIHRSIQPRIIHNQKSPFQHELIQSIRRSLRFPTFEF